MSTNRYVPSSSEMPTNSSLFPQISFVDSPHQIPPNFSSGIVTTGNSGLGEVSGMGVDSTGAWGMTGIPGSGPSAILVSTKRVGVAATNLSWVSLS